MERVIVLKRFSLAFILGVQLNATPVIQNVAIAPIHWHGIQSLSLPKKDIKDYFHTVVTDARRFRVVHADLVETMWQTERSKLAENYDIHAFVTLNIEVEEDRVRYDLALVDKQQKVLLTETQLTAKGSIDNVRNLPLQPLFYRLINRLPIDAHVISVQGRFVSLAGGARHGLNPGEVYQVIRAEISATHPQNHSWIGFRETVRAEVRLVEVKEYTSVAEIKTQVEMSGVQSGDGIRINALPSRRFYQSSMAQNEDKIVLLQPLVDAQKSDSELHQEGKVVTDKNELPESNDQEPVEASILSLPGSPFVRSYMDRIESSVFRLGLSQISFKGPNVSSRYKVWNPNRLSGMGYTSINEGWLMGLGLGLHHGSLTKGSFLGLDLDARVQRQNLPQQSFGTMYFGFQASAQTLSVRRSTYGGHDILFLEPFIGLKTRVTDRRLEYVTEIGIPIIASGQVGYGGSKYVLRSVNGYRWHNEIINPDPDSAYGGGFIYSNYTFKAESDIKRAELTLFLSWRKEY
jgi:hypothetical protein